MERTVGQAQGLGEPEAPAPVALSCLQGVDEMALQKVSGLAFGVFGRHPDTHLELQTDSREPFIFETEIIWSG